MSTFKVQKVEFEPPVKGDYVKPFSGYVCIAMTDNCVWFSGCDLDSAVDAFEKVERQAGAVDWAGSVKPHTVQMFRVDPA